MIILQLHSHQHLKNFKRSLLWEMANVKDRIFLRWLSNYYHSSPAQVLLTKDSSPILQDHFATLLPHYWLCPSSVTGEPMWYALQSWLSNHPEWGTCPRMYCSCFPVPSVSFLPMHTDYGVSKELIVFRTLLQHIVKKQQRCASRPRSWNHSQILSFGHRHRHSHSYFLLCLIHSKLILQLLEEQICLFF